jgi:twinkle protein
MATWAALAAGFRRCVGLPASLAGEGRQPHLEAVADLLRDIPRAVICMFDDEHGQTLRANIADTIGAVRCQWVTYPQGCSDLPGTLRKFKARGVQETIARARWYSMPGLHAMSELPEPALNPAYGTGIVGLDEHMRLRRGDLTIISRRPRRRQNPPSPTRPSAASRSVSWLPGDLGQLRAAFSKPDHRTSLRTFHAGKPETIMSPAEKAAADAWIDEHFRFLVPDDDTEASLDWLLDMLGRGRHPVRSLRHRDRSLERPGAQAARRHDHDRIHGRRHRADQALARKRRVHVAVVAHHPRRCNATGTASIRSPTLYDIADSAHWANKADLGVMVWRKTGDTEAEIAVVKSPLLPRAGDARSSEGHLRPEHSPADHHG